MTHLLKMMLDQLRRRNYTQIDCLCNFRDYPRSSTPSRKSVLRSAFGLVQSDH